MTTIRYISPMLNISDMDRSVAFYRDVLQFNVDMHTSHYSILERDGSFIHLHPADDEIMSKMRGHIEIYIAVDSLDDLWEHARQFQDKGVRIREPFTQPYGMREFHVDDPDGTTVFVGQAV